MVHMWPRGQAQWEPGAAIRTLGAGRSQGEEALPAGGKGKVESVIKSSFRLAWNLPFPIRPKTSPVPTMP